MSADKRLIKTAAETTLAESFAAAKTRLPGKGEIAVRREEAFRRFEQLGLPHRRVEEWKYTDLRALMRDAKPLAQVPDARSKQRAKTAGAIVAGVDARRIVFAEGAFVPVGSAPSRPVARRAMASLARALAEGDAAFLGWTGAPRTAEFDVA